MNDLMPMNQPQLPSLPSLPMIPQIIANAMPVQTPQMTWESGIIKDFFHNWKLERLQKARETEALIAESDNRRVKANLDTIYEIVTFSGRLQMEVERGKHEQARMEHDKKMWEMEEKKYEGEIIEQQLKNMLLQGEVKLNEVELKIKMKNMEEILGGINETD